MGTLLLWLFQIKKKLQQRAGIKEDISDLFHSNSRRINWRISRGWLTSFVYVAALSLSALIPSSLRLLRHHRCLLLRLRCRRRCYYYLTVSTVWRDGNLDVSVNMTLKWVLSKSDGIERVPVICLGSWNWTLMHEILNTSVAVNCSKTEIMTYRPVSIIFV